MEKEWERRDKTTKRQRDNTKRREKEKVEGGKREIVRESKASVRYRALMLKHIGQPPGWHAGDTIRLVGAKSLVISILMLTSCATWGQPPLATHEANGTYGNLRSEWTERARNAESRNSHILTMGGTRWGGSALSLFSKAMNVFPPSSKTVDEFRFSMRSI